jgi:subtilase family serine protease
LAHADLDLDNLINLVTILIVCPQNLASPRKNDRGGKMSRFSMRFLCLLTSLAFSAAVQAQTKLPGSIPSWANAKTFVAAANPSDNVGFRVYLSWNNPLAVEALARAVSDPASSSYRAFLTPAQFRQQFAPSQAQVGAVQAWLRSQGFSVEYTPQNNHYVSAEGTVSQASAAFATSFGMYSIQGLTLRSPSSQLSIPDSLAGVVSGVVGLDDSAQFVHTNHTTGDAPPPAAFVSAQPCSAYWGQQQAVGFTNPYGPGTLPYAPCGYTPQQIKGAYGLGSTGLDGSGQTVAIIDAYASPTIVGDVNQWSINRGLPQLRGNQFSQVVAPGTYHHPERGLKQDPQGWYGEETLDVEAVHGMAPGANIVFVGAPNNFQDLDAALNHVVDRGLAQIVSNSYGFDTELLPPGFIQPVENTIVQGVIEGIGIYFSSGDNSDESLVEGYVTTDWPASSPFVTAVGGTTLAVGASNNYLFETGWGTFTSTWKVTSSTWSPTPPGVWLYGGGGGVSRIFAEPSYQVGVVPASVFSAQGRTGRAVPDISANADPNAGYLIGETQTFPDGTVKYSEYRIGGTSLSCPLVAGIMALADQNIGSPHGFANPVFYSHPGAFTDVISPASTVAVVRTNYVNSIDASAGLAHVLRTANQTLSLQTTPGYDDVTGLGSPTAAILSH